MKQFVKRIAAIRQAIKVETLTAAEHHADYQASLEKIAELQAQQSEIEAEAAAAGIAPSDVHAAVDEKR